MRKFLLLLVILLLPVGTMSIQEQELISENTTDSTFSSRWNTTLTSTGSSDSDQINLQLESVGNYNFVVNWGDGTNDTITSWDQAEVTHTYSSEGIYNLTIDGTLDGWSFNNDGDRLKIIDISQWGDLKLGNSGSYFFGANNLQISATDAPDLLGTTTLTYMFSFASSFNQDIGDWEVSRVTDMNRMFSGASSFNQDIGNWNVSNVRKMFSMFSGVTLSTENYDNLLINWAELALQNGVYFHAGNSLYSSQSTASRQKIIETFTWTITDGGPAVLPSASIIDPDLEATSLSETEDTEDAFLNTFHFYSLSSLLVIAIIRIGRRKKKFQ